MAACLALLAFVVFKILDILKLLLQHSPGPVPPVLPLPGPSLPPSGPICATQGCLAMGTASMASLGCFYNGSDPQIAFCNIHFPRMAETYFHFKAIEEKLCWRHMCWTPSRRELEEFEDAIRSRQQMQASLKPDIVAASHGHARWLAHLIELGLLGLLLGLLGLLGLY